MVRYVSNSSWSRTRTNEENTYWAIIIFNCEIVIFFSFFECYLWLLGFSIDFFKDCTVFSICILLTVFQWFDELAFSLCWRVFCSFQKQCCSYINKPTTHRCCHWAVFPQMGVRNFWQQQNLLKISLNELRFCKNAVLQHATLTGKKKLKIFLLGAFYAFCEASLITAILQNSLQRHI